MGSTSPLLGLSTFGNTAPMLSLGGTCGFILVDPRAAEPKICGGIIGGGGARFCSMDPERCTAQSHRVKVWTKRSKMSKGFYIIHHRKSQVYAEPCLFYKVGVSARAFRGDGGSEGGRPTLGRELFLYHNFTYEVSAES